MRPTTMAIDVSVEATVTAVRILMKIDRVGLVRAPQSTGHADEMESPSIRDDPCYGSALAGALVGLLLVMPRFFCCESASHT
jgi:hypothetical protein